MSRGTTAFALALGVAASSCTCAEASSRPPEKSSLHVPLPDGWKASALTGGLQVGPDGRTVLQLESTTRPFPAAQEFVTAVEGQGVLHDVAVVGDQVEHDRSAVLLDDAQLEVAGHAAVQQTEAVAALFHIEEGLDLAVDQVLVAQVAIGVEQIEGGLSAGRVNGQVDEADRDVVLGVAGQLEAGVPQARVARDFVQALIDGRFVAADSFLNPDLQSEIPPASLQRKWLNLQTRTGNVVRVREVLPSEQSGEMKLVMVTIEFTRLTDNLYVILDRSNAIVGVDFPTEPAAPKAVPTR